MLPFPEFDASGWWYGKFWALKGTEMRWFDTALEALLWK